MEKIKKIFIVCGEPSGDLLAANLITAIKKLDPTIKIFGVGGTDLAKTKTEIFYHIKDLAVMGLFDVLRKLPKFVKLKQIILKKINLEKPDCLILVDFSGFNLRLAKTINKRIPTIYYVSPQIWASREKRIEYIKKFVSQMVVLFKFEEEFFHQRQIQTQYAGHPLIDIVRPTMPKQELIKNFGFSPDKKTIALLPGSRKREIKLILPLMLKAAQLINKKIPETQFVIAKTPALDAQIYIQAVRGSGLDLKIIDDRTYDCLEIADASLVCSGTATLEAAIILKPFVIVYKMNLLNYLLYAPQVKIPYIGIVNIISGKKIVPEFIQYQAKPEMIARATLELLQQPEKAKQMLEDLTLVKTSLGVPGAAERAAKLILEFIYP